MDAQSVKKFSKGWAFSHIFGIIKAVVKVRLKQKENRSQMKIFSIEKFVPQEHLLRKIDSAIDFTHLKKSRLKCSTWLRQTLQEIGPADAGTKVRFILSLKYSLPTDCRSSRNSQPCKG